MGKQPTPSQRKSNQIWAVRFSRELILRVKYSTFASSLVLVISPKTSSEHYWLLHSLCFRKRLGLIFANGRRRKLTLTASMLLATRQRRVQKGALRKPRGRTRDHSVRSRNDIFSRSRAQPPTRPKPTTRSTLRGVWLPA